MKFPALVLAALTLSALADQRGDTPGTLPSTPQEQLTKFHAPPGFEVQLVAAEPEIQKPINLNFDAAGRLWVTGSELYPWPASTDANGEPIPDFDKGWRGIVENFKVGDQAPQPSPVGRDTVRILSGFDPDGRARKITIFADRLSIPSGIQPLPRKPGGWRPPITEKEKKPQMTQMSTDGKEGAASGLPTASSAPRDSAHPRPSASSAAPSDADPKGDSAIVYSIPNIWLMTDVDGDGFAEKREPLYTGFGYTDTHGGSSSYIYWIDGWIYGTHGFKNHSEVRDRNGHVTVVDSGNTYRFRPDGTAFEIYAHGQTNPFGLAFDPLGNLFSADSHSKPVYMLLRGGYYEGIGKQHDGLGFAPRITDDDHGSSAIAGIAYYADDQWPEEYRGNLFNGNPVTQRINRDRLEWHGSTPKAIRMPDFLTCDDPWFRPVNLKLGPDGALYIADFYNPIIGHYEVPLTHPSRDHTHGRIWRVVFRGEKASAERERGAASGRVGILPAGSGILPERSFASERPSGETPDSAGGTPTLPEMPDLTKLDAPALIEKLADPSLEVRRLATNELVDRVGADVLPLLNKAVGETRVARDAKAFDPAQSANPLHLTGGAAAQRAHAAWAAERLRLATASPDPTLAFSSTLNDLPSVRFHGLRVLRESPFPKAGYWIMEALLGPDPALRRAAADALVMNSDVLDVDALMRAGDLNDDGADTEIIYDFRLALRDELSRPGSFIRANEYAGMKDAGGAELGRIHRERLADVALAIPTADSADFLLTHLARTKLETPRAGEYLKHAALHLPAEKFGAVVELVAKVGDVPLPRRIALAGAITQAARQRKIALPEELTAWAQSAMIEALASKDEGLARQGVEAVRDVKIEAKLGPLAKIIRDEAQPEALRIAAMESVANLPASRELLVATLGDPRHFKLRKRASELLVAGGFAEILAALPPAPFDLAQSMAGDLIENGDAGCGALLDLIEAGKASPRLLRNRSIEILLHQRAADLQARAKELTRDLPPENERLDKVIAQRAKDFAKAKTDAEHGAQIFQTNCALCHRFRNAGGNVGPNLDGAVTRGRARLIEDILDPSRNVDPGFRQTLIEMNDGQMFAGTNVREQSDAVLLTDATGKELDLPKAEIKTRTQTQLSLMPPAFETVIPSGDFDDLLAYLLSEIK